MTEEQQTQGGLVDDVQDTQTDDVANDEHQADSQQADEEKPTENNEQAQDELNEFVGAPETYTNDNIKLSENMSFDETMLGEFTDFAKKVNMSQKAYEQSVTYGVKLVEQAQKHFIEAMQQQQQQQILAYQKAAFSDKDIGGENYQPSLTTAKLAYRQFVSPELDAVLKQTGLEFHKDLIKMFKSVGEMMQNDTLKGGKNPPSNNGNKAEEKANRMFPSMANFA